MTNPIIFMKMPCKLLCIIQVKCNFLALPDIKVFGHLLTIYKAASDWNKLEYYRKNQVNVCSYIAIYILYIAYSYICQDPAEHLAN